MREALPVSKALQPAGFTRGVGGIETDIEVDRLDQVLAGRIGKKIFQKIAPTNRCIVAEDDWLHAVLQPWIAVMLEVVEMVVRIDDWEVVHGSTGCSGAHKVGQAQFGRRWKPWRRPFCIQKAPADGG